MVESKDLKSCYVQGVVEHGQGWNVGLMKDDIIISIQNQTIPLNETAYDIVMGYLQTLPRPVTIRISRLKSLEDTAQKRDVYPSWSVPFAVLLLLID